MNNNQEVKCIGNSYQSYWFFSEKTERNVKSNNIIFQENENLFESCFNDRQKTPLFPFGDWRDLCYSTVFQSERDLSIISFSSTINHRDFLINKEMKTQSQNSNFLENTEETKQLDLNNLKLFQDNKVSISENIHLKIFKIEKKRSKKDYSVRRDVINKSIVRYFLKYLEKMLKSKIMKNKWLKSADLFIQRIQSVLSKSTIFEVDSPDHEPTKSYKDIVHFVLWIVSKSSNLISKQLSADEYSEFFGCKLSDLLQSKCESACIMRSILKAYSHSLLQQFFECSTLRLLFKKFLDSEADTFVRQLPDCKRAKAAEILQDFETNIFLLSN